MIPYIVLFLLSFTAYVVTETVSVSIVFLLYFLFGSFVTGILNRRPYKAYSLKVFQLSFFAYFIYALVSFLYMKANDYEYLQSFDGYSVYIPYTTQLLNTDSFVELISEIYNTSHYSFVGSILVLFVYTGKLSQLFDGELYLTIQLSIIIFASWVPVVIYRMLLLHNIPNRKSYHYTMVYSLLSIHFMMATFIVRDMPIALFYTIIIYLTFKTYSTRNIIYITLLVILILSIRVSSGIFAFFFLCLVVYVHRYTEKGAITPRTLSVAFFMIILVGVSIVYFDTALNYFFRNQESYGAAEAADQGGESTKAAFNVLPPIFAEIAKTIYNQIMPIPSWRRMIQTSFRPEAYNFVNFPEIGATLFRYWMWGIIFVGLLDKNIRRMITKNKILLYNVFLSILFLMLQADTLGHRRMLGVYPVFFVTFCMIYEHLNLKNRKVGNFMILAIFVLLQMLGFLYLT